MRVYHPAELEEVTKTTRLLLPFTYGGEMDTVDAAVRISASHHAALVLLSDSYASDKGKGVRLEHIQQSKMEQRVAMRCCQLSLIYLPAWEFAWISRLRERISHLRPGHRRPVLRERAGQEVALLDRAC